MAGARIDVEGIALRVIERVLAEAFDAPIEPGEGVRLALGVLVRANVAQVWQAREFWLQLRTGDTTVAAETAGYVRKSTLMNLTGAWYRAAKRKEPDQIERAAARDAFRAQCRAIDDSAARDHYRPMCNLYRMTGARAEVGHLFGARDHWGYDMPKPYIAPGGVGPVVIERDGERITGLMTWGVPNNGKPVTNVRNLASPFWRSMLANPHQRCLVPVTEFQEWSAKPDAVTAKKTQHWFSVPSRPVFAFAGIWRQVEGKPHYAFLTTEPNSLVEAIHPKAMPVILDDTDYAAWLTADWADAARLVSAYPSQLMAVA
jgi:putative SOS response-associated peptidase YedK